MSQDLWGTLPPADTNPTAVSVLKEQGELLSEKTNGVLRGLVICSSASIGGRDILHFFYITCPIENNYRYEVLWTRQRNFPAAFPLEVVWNDDKSEHEQKIVETMDEFKDVVRDILQSERVQKVLLHFLQKEAA